MSASRLDGSCNILRCEKCKYKSGEAVIFHFFQLQRRANLIVCFITDIQVPVVKYIQQSGWKFMSKEEIARFSAAEEAGKLSLAIMLNC